MSLIQQRYQNCLDALTPKERIARSIAMFHWSREFICRQIQRETGVVDPEHLKWAVAMRLYGADPRTREMIQRMLAHVSD